MTQHWNETTERLRLFFEATVWPQPPCKHGRLNVRMCVCVCVCPRKVKGVSIARSIRSYSRYGRAIRGRPAFEGSANCRLGAKGNRGRRERGRSGRAAISDISPWSVDHASDHAPRLDSPSVKSRAQNLRYRSVSLKRIQYFIPPSLSLCLSVYLTVCLSLKSLKLFHPQISKAPRSTLNVLISMFK